MDKHSRDLLRKAAYNASMEGHARRQERITGTLPMDPGPRTPVTRKPRGKSATALTEELAGLLTERAEQIQEKATAEARHYLAKALADLAAAPADQVTACQYAGEQAEVTDGYRAGLLLAARLVADPGFEL